MSLVEARLKAAGLEIPKPSKPVGLYQSAVLTGNLLVVSGHGPLKADRTLIRGRVGETISIQEAAEAAQVTALNTLATVKKYAGSLDNVIRVVKVLGLVRAIPDFTEHPRVLDGFTSVLQTAFGVEPGSPARSAIGVSSLPDGICVEVESIFEIKVQTSH